MAHTKAGGSKMHQGTDVRGKRLGLKVSEGQYVKAGEILARQHGFVYLPGLNVRTGRDYTLFAVTEGKVHFRNAVGKKRGRKLVDVVVTDKV